MRTFIFLLLLLPSFSLLAQENELKEENKFLNRILFQFAINYTPIDNTAGGEYQGKATMHVHPNLQVGISAGGFFSSKNYDKYLQNHYIIEGGYGGIVIEPVVLNNYFVYFSFPVLIGAGQVSYVRQDESWEPEGSYFTKHTANWLVMPGMQINFSISPYVHLALLAQYRFSSDVDLYSQGYKLAPKDIARGWTVGLGFKFGNFKKK